MPKRPATAVPPKKADPPPDPKYDPKHIDRFCAGIEALLGDLNNSDAQDLTAIAVRMSAHDRDRLLDILTRNAGG